MTVHEALAEMTRIMDGISRAEHRASLLHHDMATYLEIESAYKAAYDMIEAARNSVRERHKVEDAEGRGFAL